MPILTPQWDDFDNYIRGWFHGAFWGLLVGIVVGAAGLLVVYGCWR